MNDADATRSGVGRSGACADGARLRARTRPPCCRLTRPLTGSRLVSRRASSRLLEAAIPRRRRQAGKRFAVMWELRGCPYCKERIWSISRRPEIEDYIKANFEILAAQYRRRAQGEGFRRQRDFREGAGGEIRRALHADVSSSFPRRPEASPSSRRRSARSRAPRRCAPDDFLALFRSCARRGTRRRSSRYLRTRSAVVGSRRGLILSVAASSCRRSERRRRGKARAEAQRADHARRSST